jgi:hypothetical protein
LKASSTNKILLSSDTYNTELNNNTTLLGPTSNYTKLTSIKLPNIGGYCWAEGDNASKAASNILTTLNNNYVDNANTQIVGGNKTFSGQILFSTFAPTTNLGYLTSWSYNDIINMETTSIGYSTIVRNGNHIQNMYTSHVPISIGNIIISTYGIYIINWQVEIQNITAFTQSLLSLSTWLGYVNDKPFPDGSLQLDNNSITLPGSYIIEDYPDSYYKINTMNTRTLSGSFVYKCFQLNKNIYQLIAYNPPVTNVFNIIGTVQVTRIS